MAARFLFFLILLLLLPGPSEGFSPPERRRPQFQTEAGYYIVPAPYSLPGVGQGFALIGSATNIADTYTDLYGFAVGGGLTDDYLDPRQGFRLEVGPSWSPPRRSSAPNYYRMEYNATAYLPIGRRNTWAFNHFRSDAVVLRKGETDPAVLEREEGLDCGAVADPSQQRLRLQVIDNTIAANRFGTATGLGGRSRLRSYPQDRYTGAHTVFYGTEFRWNLTEEFTPFNIFIMKDIRRRCRSPFFMKSGASRRDRAPSARRCVRPTARASEWSPRRGLSFAPMSAPVTKGSRPR